MLQAPNRILVQINLDERKNNMRIVDLSVAIDSEVPSDPPHLMPKIRIIDHKEGADECQELFGNCGVENLPEGNGIASAKLELTDHAGTHIDAPFHFYPTMNGGERSWTIDEVPLEWCIGDGVVVDFRDKEDGYLVQPEDFEEYFRKINYTLKDGDIVLLMTGAYKAWGTMKFLGSGCGVSQAATLWLIDHGSHMMGTDAWSWDVPMPVAARRFKETGDPSILWEGHRTGRVKAYCHMEKLTNLDKLPYFGFKVVCFPVKIKGASAGWTRAVAIFDD